MKSMLAQSALQVFYIRDKGEQAANRFRYAAERIDQMLALAGPDRQLHCLHSSRCVRVRTQRRLYRMSHQMANRTGERSSHRFLFFRRETAKPPPGLFRSLCVLFIPPKWDVVLFKSISNMVKGNPIGLHAETLNESDRCVSPFTRQHADGLANGRVRASETIMGDAQTASFVPVVLFVAQILRLNQNHWLGRGIADHNVNLMLIPQMVAESSGLHRMVERFGDSRTAAVRSASISFPMASPTALPGLVTSRLIGSGPSPT
jgi:hypothetical protein